MKPSKGKRLLLALVLWGSLLPAGRGGRPRTTQKRMEAGRQGPGPPRRNRNN